jgi:hypothetical protein
MEQAEDEYKRVISLAPGSEVAEKARAKLEELEVHRE